jgi:hypothetical protein
VLFFHTGVDPYYHTAEDTFDKLEPETMRRSGVVALGVLERLIQ